MLTALVIVFILQINGRFLPQHIILQFDDEVTPHLSTYSGLFKLDVDYRAFGDSRIVYRRNRSTIGYCSRLNAWTFGYRERSNYCEDILALSSKSSNNDIALILGQPWFVRIGGEESERILPMDRVFFDRGCGSDLDCGGTSRGSCVDERCLCLEDQYFGLRCNYAFEEVCETIRVDEQTDEFTGLRRTVAYEYNALRDPNGTIVQAYHHPVYVDSDAASKPPPYDVILYTGLRWMLTAVDLDKAFFSGSANFHASHEVLGPIEAATEIVYLNSATDERPAPTNMQWFLPGSQNITEMDPVLGINTVLVCSRCGPENPCAFGNTCAEDGSCVCNKGERGSLCQVIPVGALLSFTI